MVGPLAQSANDTDLHNLKGFDDQERRATWWDGGRRHDSDLHFDRKTFKGIQGSAAHCYKDARSPDATDMTVQSGTFVMRLLAPAASFGP